MKTLTAIGRAVSFETEEGEVLGVRGSILWDPSGEAWPTSSLLIMSFDRAGKAAKDVPKFSRGWFGDYVPREGRAALPPKDLTAWEQEAEVRTLYYTRIGEDDRDMEHPIGTMGGWLGKIIPVRFGKVILYRRGSASRCDAAGGWTITSAGIVAP